MANLLPTFIAALRSVGTAFTMAGAGSYLHRKGFIVNDGTRALAIVSSQVAIPSLLFSKIIYCDQNRSDEPCPSVTDNINQVAVLLFWPIYVVLCGMLVGSVVARLARAPEKHRNSILAACALGNSTGLPLTLLSVIHSNFSSSTSLGRVDPTAFLSIYLLFYPVLQWGIGGFLLAPSEDDRDKKRQKINDKCLGGEEADASIYVSPGDIGSQATLINSSSGCTLSEFPSMNTLNEYPSDLSFGLPLDADDESGEEKKNGEEANLLVIKEDVRAYNSIDITLPKHATEKNYECESQQECEEKFVSQDVLLTVVETIIKIASKALQPPVIGAILGLVIAAISPIRGIFVNLVDRDDGAPLEWFFDGIYSIGQAAVPINMLVLGINLSEAAKTEKGSKGLMSESTMVAIVIGKMVVMPIIGIASVILLDKYVWDISDEIRAPFLLVAMIEFITPTANNVMIMVELSGSDAKAGIAKSIGYQYAAAPLVLSFMVFACVYVAVHS